MFIIKAVVRSDVGPEPYTLFTAERIRVTKPPSSEPPRPTSVNDPQLCVWLTDDHNDSKDILYVGSGIDQYCSVYIMNAQGKTVDSIHAELPAIRVAA